MESDQKNIRKKFKDQDLVVKFAIITTAVGILIFVAFVYTLYLNGYINHSWSISIDDASKIGGFVGGFIGAIWTLAGILLLYKTLILQKNELKGTKTLLENQIFESRFFSFLDHFIKRHQILRQEFVNSKQDGELYNAKDEASKIKDEEKDTDEEKTEKHTKRCKEIFKALKSFFINTDKNNDSIIHPKFISYFKSLEFLVNQIEKYSHKDEKENYRAILLSNLTDDEIQMSCYYYYLFFDAIEKDNKKKNEYRNIKTNIIMELKIFENIDLSSFYIHCDPRKDHFIEEVKSWKETL